MILHVSWLILVVASAVIVQSTTEANCTDPSFNWVSALAVVPSWLNTNYLQMFNSEGQSPCRVAEILVDPCVQGRALSIVPMICQRSQRNFVQGSTFRPSQPQKYTLV